MVDEGIEGRLKILDGKVDNIQQTLSVLAVQNVQITQLKEADTLLFKKVDRMGEEVTALRTFQASCPRTGALSNIQASINKLWVLVIPIALALLGVAFRLATMAPTPTPVG